VPRKFLEPLFLAMLYLAAKPSHVGGGVDVDGLACFLHHPTVYRSQSFLLGATPSVML
jgi:hypothetical protein